jgi:hypothetical protein
LVSTAASRLAGFVHRPASAARTGRVCLVAALLLALAVGAPSAASAAASANPTLNITFYANGTIAVTLPDGTPVGTASGSPTVIPAGYYSVVETGPGGCAQVPYISLQGPQVNFVDNLDGDEVESSTVNEQFVPNSTYTWSNNSNPSVVYTFQTSSTVVGTPPATAGSGGISSSAHSTAPSVDLLGSTAASSVPFRGGVSGSVSAAGKLALDFESKAVSKLVAGRYTFTINDKSAKTGFMLEQTGQQPVILTNGSYIGRRSFSVVLTTGSWFFAGQASGPKQRFVVVK